LPKDVLNAREVAQYLRVSERTVLGWAQQGEIPAARVGKRWRFIRSQIEDWLRRKSAPSVRSAPVGRLSIERVLSPERVLILPGARSKREVLQRLVDCLAGTAAVKNADELAQAVFAREELMSTGIGLGVAVPHVRLASVLEPVMAAASCPDGVQDYESLDGEPVRLVFLIAAERDAHAKYIRLLSQLSRAVKDAGARRRLIEAGDGAAFHRALVEVCSAQAEPATRGEGGG